MEKKKRNSEVGKKWTTASLQSYLGINIKDCGKGSLASENSRSSTFGHPFQMEGEMA